MACHLALVGMRTLLSRKLPFCHKRFAASTSKTGTTGGIFGKKFHTSLGNGMVPKSPKRQTFLTRCPCKSEQFTLNLRQRCDSGTILVNDELIKVKSKFL